MTEIQDKPLINADRPDILFDKFIIYKDKKKTPCDESGKAINLKDLELEGCIAFTRDTKHVGWLHVLIYTAQKLHALIMGLKKYDGDVNMCHGMIITGYSDKQDKPNDLLLTHAVYSGIKSSRWNYFADPDVTEVIVYRPKSEDLRSMIVKHAYQTAFIPEANRKDKLSYAEKKSPFSLKDMISSIFHTKLGRGKLSKRTAYIIADLLQGKQLKNAKNKPRGYFCTAYALSVLQGSIFLNALTEEEKKRLLYKKDGKLRSRARLAKRIYYELGHENKYKVLNKLYRENVLCGIDTRFIMSCEACKVLDKMSVVQKLA